MRRIILFCLLLCLLPAAALADQGATLWRVERVVLAPEAALSEEQAATWVDKRARITQTSISFEGRTCRVTPDITRVQAGVFLASYQMSPSELGIEDALLELVETGCDIPAFQTMLALPDGRFVLLHKGAFIFLRSAEEEPETLRELTVPEAGLLLRLPGEVRTLAPGETPEQGLGIWYQASPLHDLPHDAPPERDAGAPDGDYPFSRAMALRDRAALAATAGGADAEDAFPAGMFPGSDTPPGVLSGSVRAHDFGTPGSPAVARSYVSLGAAPCEVRFTSFLVVYHAGWVVQFGLEAAPEVVVRENPGYFLQALPESGSVNATSACPGGVRWTPEDGMRMAFWSTLRNERATGLAASWQRAFAYLLQGVEIVEPSGRPSYLAQDPEVQQACRQLPASVFASLFPNTILVPEQTFGLRFPWGRTGLEHACLVTLSDGVSQRQAVTTSGKVLQSLPVPGDVADADPPPTVTRALAVEDMDNNGLPDVIAVMQRRSGDGGRDNRLYFAVAAPETRVGLRWRYSRRYAEAAADMDTVAAIRQRVSGMRLELRRQVGREFELVGSVEDQFGSLIFVPEMAPDVASEPVRFVVFETSRSEEFNKPGRRLWLEGRVVLAENLFGPLTFTFDVLQHKFLPDSLDTGAGLPVAPEQGQGTVEFGIE